MTGNTAVISISSHVARGSVGNRAGVFAYEANGHSVWAVPTLILPWHPGHGKATRIVPEPEQFGSLLDDLLGAPWTTEVAAISTGYMADATQVGLIADFVAAMKRKHPSIVVACDPVIGDAGGLYVASQTASAIRDRLLPLAAIATPNRHELAWLCGASEPQTPVEARVMARGLGPQSVVVTSAPAFMRGNIANLLVSGDLALVAEHRQLAHPPSGTGDLFCAMFVASLLAGASPERALERACAATFELVAEAVANGRDELALAANAGSLQRPMAMVTLRNLGLAAARTDS